MEVLNPAAGSGSAEVIRWYPHPGVKVSIDRINATTPDISYLHRDQLQSVQLETDSAGAEVVERVYPTRRLQERCSDGKGGEVVNDYWVDLSGGRIRQSRQWAGPVIGYIRTRQVVD